MIGIVDYDAGNLRSVTNALESAGIEYAVTDESDTLSSCDGIILPGVGAAPGAMRSLTACKLDVFLRETSLPLLGICLGMQVLFERSSEGDIPCLGIVAGTVEKLQEGKVTIPHMGWNTVRYTVRDPLWDGIEDGTFYYFAHSYVATVGPSTIAETDCGIPFTSAIHLRNIYGVQFHPEKSGQHGLRLLKNFDAICRSSRR